MEATDKHRILTAGIVKQLNRILINSLGSDNFHLLEVDVDVDCRHEAFWMVGGIIPPISVQKQRAGKKWSKKFEKDPVDRPFQYLGKPLLALRHVLPLQPYEDIEFDKQDFRNDKTEIPSFKFDPHTLGYLTEYRHGTTIPGMYVFFSKFF